MRSYLCSAVLTAVFPCALVAKSGENNYLILDAKGEGQFVGVMLSVFNNQWGAWNEGDDMIWIDGQQQPRIHGTSGEDYFNSAWGFGQLYATRSSAWSNIQMRSPAAALLCTAGTSRPRCASINRSK